METFFARTTLTLAALLLAFSLASAAERALLVNPARATLAAASAGDRALAGKLARLRTMAQERGSTRLIVGVRAAFAPEGGLAGSQALAQRTDIGNAQAAVLQRLADAHGGNKPSTRFETIPFLALEATPAEFDTLASDSNVLSIEEDVLRRTTLAESSPLIGATASSAAGHDGSGQVVAILDTGVDKTHPFLSGKVVSEACYSSNVTSYSSTTVCPDGATDSIATGSGVNCGADCDHGTHVAGIVAGSGASFSGVARGANLIAVQVFSRFNSTAYCDGAASCVMSYTSDIVKGLERVYALRNTHSIAAVNMSLGGGRYTNQATCDNDNLSTKAAIDNLRAAGIATVISSGNSGYTDSTGAPGCISTAVSVGSTWDAAGLLLSCEAGSTVNKVACYSNSASFLNLLAPGSAINSSIPGGAYSVYHGTSMAAPQVAGAWAVLKQAAPGTPVIDALNTFSGTGVPVTDTRNGIVKPRIDLVAALASLFPSATYTLTVNSSGAAGVMIGASPSTYAGTTSYSKTGIAIGTSMTLTAPSSAGGVMFSNWDGCDSVSGPICTVTMLGAKNVTARFASVPSRYTKIANSGADLPDSAVLGSGTTQWACTRDNTTGLIWEVKTADGATRDMNTIYTNLDSHYGSQFEIDAANNSIGFVNAVNATALCGSAAWRMPSVEELLGLLNRSFIPRIDPTYFPNTVNTEFWSSTEHWFGSPSVHYPYAARTVDFSSGSDGDSFGWERQVAIIVRLVRGGQSSGALALSVSAAGSGSGAIASDSGGIDCTRASGVTAGTCSASLAGGATVTLTATPVSGDTFSGWSGACSGMSQTCIVAMAAEKSVTANFYRAFASQAISLGMAPTIAAGGKGVLSATASSGLPVVFSSLATGVCTVSGDTRTGVTDVTGVTAGTCTIAADQPGDSSYSAAPQVVGSFSVSAAPFARYTKIANSGADLPVSAVPGNETSQWACTRDNTTGLIWEIKTVDGGLRDTNKVYTNYDTHYSIQSGIDTASNSIGLLNAVNAAALCGSAAWRMPSLGELATLKNGDYASVSLNTPAIDPTYFPNTQATSYWTNTPITYALSNAWAADFGWSYLIDGGGRRYYRYPVRLVRAGQSYYTVSLPVSLSVSAAGSGSGAIASDLGSINCTSTDGIASGTCSTSLAGGATVTLTATPASGSTFAGWSGACNGANQICTVVMAAAKSVTASFNRALASQTIAFGTAPTVAVGGTGTVSATATSGLPVTFSSLTASICTVSGSTVTGVAAGICTIAANQAGNSGTSAAPQVTSSFNIAAIPPDPPAITSITAGSGSATIHFSAPGNTGGAPISRYTATCMAGGQPTRTASGAVSPITVRNLTGGVIYQCALTATNEGGGASAASAPLPVTPMPGKKSSLAPILMLLLD